jgi:hypothetical protein
MPVLLRMSTAAERTWPTSTLAARSCLSLSISVALRAASSANLLASSGSPDSSS